MSHDFLNTQPMFRPHQRFPISVLAGIFLLTGADLRCAQAEDLQSVQIWIEESASFSPHPKLSFWVSTEQRFATEDRFLRQLETTPEIFWKMTESQDVFVGYKRIDSWDPVGAYASGDLAIIGHAVSFPFGEGWSLASRQRFEAGVEAGMTTGQFRHRLTLSHQNEQFLWGLRTSLSNEWYYLFDTDRISQNRLKLAFSHPINEHAEWEIYAMRRDDWQPGDVHLLTPVVGVSFEVLF